MSYHRLGGFDIQLVVKVFDIPSEYAYGISKGLGEAAVVRWPVLDRCPYLPHKAAIEAHPVKRFGEVFQVDYDPPLFDVPARTSKT